MGKSYPENGYCEELTVYNIDTNSMHNMKKLLSLFH